MNDELLRLLEAALSQPESFDEGVEAARNACAAGASIAAGAITAAAYYDNPLTGLGALRELMARLADAPGELGAWLAILAPARHPETGDADFTPGFGFLTPARAARTLAVCRQLAGLGGAPNAPNSPSAQAPPSAQGAPSSRVAARTLDRAGPSGVAWRCAFLLEHHGRITEVAGPLNETGLAALAYLDASVDLESAERRWFGCKLSVAVAEAQKARRAGIAAFPFALGSYVYDGARPAPQALDRRGLERALGLDGRDG